MTTDKAADRAAEKEVVRRILERFPVLEGRVHIQRDRRVVMDPLVRRDFEKVFPFLTGGAGFDRLLTLFGSDEKDWLVITYALVNSDEVVLLLRQRAPKTRPAVRSVSSRFPQAVWQEQELSILLGVAVEELPEGESYPLPQDWPKDSHPLRKEWDPRRFNKSALTYNRIPAGDAGEKEAGL